MNENSNELSLYFSDREDITSEHVLEVLYLEQKAAPEPQDSVNHDDWVSGVDIHSGLILSCSYDNTVCLWDAKDGTKKLQIPGHVGPARAVAFINVDEDKNAVFASASYDQTVVLYKYCNQTNSIEGMNVGKGKKNICTSNYLFSRGDNLRRKIDLSIFTKSEAIHNSKFSLSKFQYVNALVSSGFLHNTI